MNARIKGSSKLPYAIVVGENTRTPAIVDSIFYSLTNHVSFISLEDAAKYGIDFPEILSFQICKGLIEDVEIINEDVTVVEDFN